MTLPSSSTVQPTARRKQGLLLSTTDIYRYLRKRPKLLILFYKSRGKLRPPLRGWRYWRRRANPFRRVAWIGRPRPTRYRLVQEWKKDRWRRRLCRHYQLRPRIIWNLIRSRRWSRRNSFNRSRRGRRNSFDRSRRGRRNSFDQSRRESRRNSFNRSARWHARYFKTYAFLSCSPCRACLNPCLSHS